jgi:hypothetical protein
MFGVNIYAIIAVVAVALFCGGFVNGCSYQQSKAEKVIREKEHQYQADADKIRKSKDEQLKVINTQLNDTIVSLRNASRADKTIDGQTSKFCDGSQLFREDGIFLAREAARADEVRVALDACYKQYEAIK